MHVSEIDEEPLLWKIAAAHDATVGIDETQDAIRCRAQLLAEPSRDGRDQAAHEDAAGHGGGKAAAHKSVQKQRREAIPEHDNRVRGCKQPAPATTWPARLP